MGDVAVDPWRWITVRTIAELCISMDLKSQEPTTTEFAFMSMDITSVSRYRKQRNGATLHETLWISILLETTSANFVHH
jgi:hypothetical protein